MLLVFPRSFGKEIMVLPLDDNFVLVIFFLVIFFVAPLVAIFYAKWAELEKSGGFGCRRKVAEATVKRAAGRSRSRFTAAGKTPTFFPTPLTSQKRCIIPNQWAGKKILTRDKKNIHQQRKLLMQQKHHYTYNTTFLSPKGEFFKERTEGSLWFECLSFTLSYLDLGLNFPIGNPVHLLCGRTGGRMVVFLRKLQ